MPAIMRLLGWKSQGLRCPDHEINCADQDGTHYSVCLIQMPNGTGKTTTLALLRAALSGSATNWDPHTISEFRKKDSSDENGYFEVRLSLNGRRATIITEFDFENSRVSYKTTHGPGRRDGFHPPSDFRRFMNENFVNFYIFDGELAQQLLDRNHTDAQVVVENLFQINSFDAMAQKIGDYWDSKAQDIGATEERGLSRRRRRLQNLRDRFSTLTVEQDKLRKKLTTLDAQLQKKKDAYHQEIKKEDARFQALSGAEKRVEYLKGKVREEALDVLDRMRDPHALNSSFADWMLSLKDGLDRVKLPESAAREFFEDLANEAECVCGRPIDENIALTIRERAGQYLGTDDVSLLNSMKTAIKDAIGDDPGFHEQDLSKRLSHLSSAVDEEREARNDLDALRLEAEQSDPAVRTAREDIDDLEKQLESVRNELEKFDSKDQSQNDENTFGIEIIEGRIETAERKLAEITHTLTEKRKRDTLTSIIKSAHRKAKEGITAELCLQANDRITRNNLGHPFRRDVLGGMFGNHSAHERAQKLHVTCVEIGIGDLFHDQPGSDRCFTEPTEFFGQIGADQAECSHLLDQRTIKGVPTCALLIAGCQLFRCESLRGFAKRLLIFCWLEMHLRSSPRPKICSFQKSNKC